MSKLERLSREEIAAMVAYLKEHPPHVRPPADLPFFDVRRIALTLTDLLAMTDYQASYIGAYRDENQAQRDRIRLLEAELVRRQDG